MAFSKSKLKSGFIWCVAITCVAILLLQLKQKVLSVHRNQLPTHAHQVNYKAVPVTAATQEARDLTSVDQRPIVAAEKDMEQKPQRGERKNLPLSGNKQAQNLTVQLQRSQREWQPPIKSNEINSERRFQPQRKFNTTRPKINKNLRQNDWMANRNKSLNPKDTKSNERIDVLRGKEDADVKDSRRKANGSKPLDVKVTVNHQKIDELHGESDINQVKDEPPVVKDKAVFNKERDKNFTRCQVKTLDFNYLNACGDWIRKCYSECECENDRNGGTRIPRIVHFIKDDNLMFSDWLAIVAANKYIKPRRINLFTRQDTSPNCWMRRLQLIRNVRVINLSSEQWLDNLNNISVSHVEHQSDLLRNAILYHYGGIYMDTDAFATKSFDPLLIGNHSVVLGRNLVDRIGNGLIVARRHSCLICEYGSQACDNFDGSWIKHSTVSLSNLVESNTTKYNILILNYTSGFFPFSWKEQHFHELFDYKSTEVSFSSDQVYALHLFGSKFPEMISERFSSIEWIKTCPSILATYIRTLIQAQLLSPTHLDEDLCVDLPHNLLS